MFGDVTHSGTFVLMGKATSPQGATAMTMPPPGEPAGPGQPATQQFSLTIQP